MKYLKLFENKAIEDICKKYEIENYHINPDGTIDVEGDVCLFDMKLEKFPLKFGTISGNFECHKNRLRNLIGGPKRVGGRFACSSNNYLTSLEGCPEYIGNGFHCSSNPKLWSMDYFPRHAKKVHLGDTPIEPIFDLFRTEYLADGGEFFSTSGTMMDFFWDMDPVYPGKVIIKWRLEKFLEGLNKELKPDWISFLEEYSRWKFK